MSERRNPIYQGWSNNRVKGHVFSRFHYYPGVAGRTHDRGEAQSICRMGSQYDQAREIGTMPDLTPSQRSGRKYLIKSRCPVCADLLSLDDKSSRGSGPGESESVWVLS